MSRYTPIIISENLAEYSVNEPPHYQEEDEVVFHIPSDHSLRLDEAPHRQDVARYLSYRTTRKPFDLVNHIRRIYFHYEAHASDELYAALLDLCIALDGKGYALCKRMIKGVKKRLQPEQYQHLLRVYIDKDQSADGERISSATSVLNRGTIGIPIIIKEADDTAERERWLAPTQKVHSS